MGKGLRRTGIAVVVLAVVGGMALDSLTAQAAEAALSSRGFGRTHTAIPSDFGIPFADATIPSDGLPLAAWWMPAKPDANPAHANVTIILVHGHSAEMGKIVRHWGENLHEAGYAMLSLDLRNHGASGNTSTGFVTYGVAESRDVEAAVVWLREHAEGLGVDPERIVLYGESMGAASVLVAAGRGLPGVAGLISDSSYASFGYQAGLDGDKRGYPRWLTDLVVTRIDALAGEDKPSQSRPDESIAHVRPPMLLMHCEDDARLSSTSLGILLENAPTGTARWLKPCKSAAGRDYHVDGWRFMEYNATVLQFLDRI